MKTIRVKGLTELRRELRKNLERKQRQLEQAQVAAAMAHADWLRAHVPVAFGELRASIVVQGTRVVVDAPHAAAVERGSRPHWAPLEPILRWVKLRGFQGLASAESVSRLPGTTTAGHAHSVAAGLREHSESSGYADLGDGATSLDAPMAIARAIQAKIAREGTKPTWFMLNSIPVARGFLAAEIRKALGRD